MEESLWIKIIKCDDVCSWYYYSIDGCFEVVHEDSDEYYFVISPNDNSNNSIRDILKSDCIIMNLTLNDIINKPTQRSDSILLEANKIVNGDRNEQYGDVKEAFTVYSEICKTTFGLDLSPNDVCKVLMAVKLGRLKYKYKRDSAVDLCGYAEILSKLNEE